MKIQVVILLALFLPGLVSGQNKRKIQPSNKIETENSNYDCIHKGRYSFSQRIQNYPFNKAIVLKVVSFEWSMNNDDVSVLDNYINGDTSTKGKIKEIITLTLSQIDTLTDIIYNNFYKGRTNQIRSAKCYRPRNGILFYDSTGRIFDFIEICFECEKIGSKSRLFEFGQSCEQKFQLLGNFFSSVGIKYGPKTTVLDN